MLTTFGNVEGVDVDVDVEMWCGHGGGFNDDNDRGGRQIYSEDNVEGGGQQRADEVLDPNQPTESLATAAAAATTWNMGEQQERPACGYRWKHIMSVTHGHQQRLGWVGLVGQGNALPG